MTPLDRVIASLELAPDLIDWQLEAIVESEARGDGVMVMPLGAQHVRVKAGHGEAFWQALGELFDDEMARL